MYSENVPKGINGPSNSSPNLLSNTVLPLAILSSGTQLCTSATTVPSFTLRAALSATPFVSERCKELGDLSPPAILLRVSPGFAEMAISSKVLSRFGIGFAFAFALLVFVFALLAYAFAVASSERSMGTTSPAAVSAVARQESNNIVLPARSSSGCVCSSGCGPTLAALSTQV